MEKLFKHQRDVIELNPAKYGLFFGTGCGKSLTAIKLAEKNANNCLVVCPKSLVDNWKNEIKKWGKKELIWTVLSKENFKKVHRELSAYDCVIVDEAHYFSNYKSQLHKSLDWYLKRHDIDYVYGLTATPYMSSSWSVYGIGRLFGRQWKWIDWKRRFFNDVKMGRRMIPVQKKGIEKEIARIVSTIGVTAKMEDLMDVPEQTFLVEHFDITGEQKKAIEDLDDMVHITRWTKIHQIIGGTLKGDGYIEDRFYKSEKLDRLLQLIGEHPKIAVVCRYNNEIRYIQNEIRRKYPNKQAIVINGHTENKEDCIDVANRSGEIVVLINAACSEGYNLWSVPIMIFYSYDFSLKNYVQMIGRILRADHLKKNVYISLIVKKTIDEDVYDCIQNKQDFHLALYNN